jgi:23S rRNA (uracil1939-C5)-methyltransferase
MHIPADDTPPKVAKINTLNAAGQGVGDHSGGEVTLAGTLPGETVSFQTFGGRRGKSRSELVDVLEASSKRTSPKCPHFGICGACKLQHLLPEAQLEFKQAQLLENLRQLGGVDPAQILSPLVGPLWNYRRKARLSVRWVEKKGRVLVGFREQNGRYVADIDTCLILDKRIADILPDLALLIASLDIFKRIPQLEVACGDADAVLVFRVLDPPTTEDENKLRTFARTSAIAVFLQPGGPTTITALEPAHVQLDYAIPEHDVRLEFGPANFVQVNAGLNQLMVDRVIDMLALNHDDTVLDLFCGLGNFTLPIARSVDQVIGIEGDQDLVSLARHNAQLNNLNNVTFEMADLAEDNVKLPGAGNPNFKILLDPPRSGAGAILPSINATGVKRLVYVSCNPVTLAQDAAVLVNEFGFQLEAAGIMDMFPHTSHIETCALFVR